MEWYKLTNKQVEQKTNTNFSEGLSTKQANKRLQKNGPNQLAEGETKSAFLLLLEQFKDFMVVVLLAATLISGLLGEYMDAIAIIAIVIINGILGFYQERKAERSLHALKELSAPQVRVLRDGKWITILSKNVVVGDVVKIKSGDRIGADLRLIKSNGLHIEESALTGESLPVMKQEKALVAQKLEIGDQMNMAFMGTMVTQGSGVGVVIATGMNTEMGKIAHLLQHAQTLTTPLQRKLEQLGKILIGTALLLTVLVVLVGIYQGHDMYKMFLAGVSLAVAAIPEGLPAIVTVALSLGVQKMIKRKAIVRKLPAVETLGCASVVCSDKTGTMTQNKMTVTKLWTEGRTIEVTGTGYEPSGGFYYRDNKIDVAKEDSVMNLLAYGLLCNHAEIRLEGKKRKQHYVLDGDPTEGALVVAAEKAGLMKQKLLNNYSIVKEFPFDSQRKMMTVIVKDSHGHYFVIAKGAPDVLLTKCNRVMWNNREQTLSPKYEEEANSTITRLASEALRTIAIAYKKIPATHSMNQAEIEADLTFIGLQGMIDPPRPEVRKAIEDCRDAGIKTVMITGDHVITAKAIAKQLNLLPEHGKVMEGHQLSELSVSELEDVVEDIYVFARVSPEHKLKIVQALQQRGHIVAMTGDGVNDAPAIKAANIGVAMGITGTDVAKEASSLVLVDDNFATIRAAIEEGRNIYENIRKFIRYLLASNVGEILVMLFAMLLALPLPLVPIQILWVNLVTDGLPAMALGLDPAEEDVMKRNPRNPNEGVFARKLGWKIISRGFLIGIVTLIAFMIALHEQPNNLVYAQTVAFATLVMAQLIHVFDCRSEKSVLHRNPFSNIPLVIAVISSILLLLVVIYYSPLQPIFHTTVLGMRDWLLILAMSAIPTFALAGFQLFKRVK
jgi:P-type Ca2+ transporter type 2C